MACYIAQDLIPDEPDPELESDSLELLEDESSDDEYLRAYITKEGNFLVYELLE